MQTPAEWIIYKYESNNKTLAEAVRFDAIREIEMDSKLVGGRFKRTLTYVFSDGTRLDVPDDADFVKVPHGYDALINMLAYEVKV